jgi:DNA segregation ATPase FtsK/SpoIIIE, S-DNA-T family
MRVSRIGYSQSHYITDFLRDITARWAREICGFVIMAVSIPLSLALASWNVRDASFSNAVTGPIKNWLGYTGAVASDLMMQILGLSNIALLLVLVSIAWRCITGRALPRFKLLFLNLIFGVVAAAGVASCLPKTDRWPLPSGFGGVIGDTILALPAMLLGSSSVVKGLICIALVVLSILSLSFAAGLRHGEDIHVPDEPVLVSKRVKEPRAKQDTQDENDDEPSAASVSLGAVIHIALILKASSQRVWRNLTNGGLTNVLSSIKAKKAAFIEARNEDHFEAPTSYNRVEPRFEASSFEASSFEASNHAQISTYAPTRTPSREAEFGDDIPTLNDLASDDLDKSERVSAPAPSIKQGKRDLREAQGQMFGEGGYELPPLSLLAEPKANTGIVISQDALEQNARLLEGVLEDFGVKGEIINIRPGPVVTLYELEPAPGIKSSRVIGLAEDIARSMCAIAARVAVVPGRNVIGIELPNSKRETVYLREMLASADFESSKYRLPICLGKTIGGEPMIVELARMPHLLIAGTTGSGKSVAVNTMILSLLYRLRPEECRLIMIDPKMLELSIYDGIPHLLTPVVTDPKKAVVALKWAVREMEQRYRKMSKVGVRNIDGFNARMLEAKEKGETITKIVQTGYDRESGEAVFESEDIALETLPYIVVLIDEMADLMLVAGKDIESLVQRLAQMARAAGIHVIMATQRPSVDVITGTIKANFPTRISFQVTSKIDSRTILSEQGAEQLLGQGDMLYMAGGGRISRVHGPFCSDEEVEQVVAHLKLQAPPSYLDDVTTEDEPSEEKPDTAVFDKGNFGEEGGDLYDQAVKVVIRDKKCSTSYIQRRLQIGYNKAASLVERMEDEGVVSAPNHAGKREVLIEDNGRGGEE